MIVVMTNNVIIVTFSLNNVILYIILSIYKLDLKFFIVFYTDHSTKFKSDLMFVSSQSTLDLIHYLCIGFPKLLRPLQNIRTDGLLGFASANRVLSVIINLSNIILILQMVEK